MSLWPSLVTLLVLYSINSTSQLVPPSRPLAPVVIESSTTSNSVSLEWSYPDAITDGVQRYEVQYKPLGAPNSNVGWNTYEVNSTQNPTGLGLGALGSRFREVQVLRTRVDPGSSLDVRKITNIEITKRGSGYSTGGALVFSGGTCSTQPEGTYTVGNGEVTSVTLTNPGSCTVLPTLVTTQTGNTSSLLKLTGSGFFKLSLNFLGQSDFNPETKTTTDWIPSNATAEQVEAALEELSMIGDIKVVRGYDNETGHIDASNQADSVIGSGTYTWRITFTWDHQDGPQHGWTFPNRDTTNPTHIWPSPVVDFPTLSVSEHTIQAPWSGTGWPVFVDEERRGGKEGAVRACSKPSEGCRVTVNGLLPDTTYTFRIRARAATYGPNAMKDVKGGLDAAWGSVQLGGRGHLGVRALKDSVASSTLKMNDETPLLVASRERNDKSNDAYEGGASMNDGGWGPYGYESLPAKTLLAAVPTSAAPPIISSSTVDSIALQITATARDGNGLRLLGFDLQYRVYQEVGTGMASTDHSWQTYTPVHEDKNIDVSHHGDAALVGNSIPLVAIGGGGTRQRGIGNPDGIFQNGNDEFDSSYASEGSDGYNSDEARRIDLNSIYMGTATIPNLIPGTHYSFRCRLVNSFGKGNWSSAAKGKTQANTTPLPPTSLTVSNVINNEAPIGQDYIRVTWQPSVARKSDENTGYKDGDETDVVAYQLQLREVGHTFGGTSEWRFDKTPENYTFNESHAFSLIRRTASQNGHAPTSLDNSILFASTTSTTIGIDARSRKGPHAPSLIAAHDGGTVAETQVIHVLPNNGQSVSGGWFQLNFNMHGYSAHDPSEKTITSRIPYNASSDVVKAKLEELKSIQRLQRVIREGPLLNGDYKWYVTFEPTTHAGDLPRMNVVLHDITGGSCVVYEEKKGVRRVPLTVLTATSRKLKNYTRYQFRVRALSAAGVASTWSTPTEPVRTLPAEIEYSEYVSPTATLASPGGTGDVVILSTSAAKRREPPRKDDPDYSAGVGGGGATGAPGEPGLVVITAYVYGSSLGQDAPRWKGNVVQKRRVSSTSFFYTEENNQGVAQLYTVPKSSRRNQRITNITIKVWGAGGGGGSHGNSTGGAGGYVQARIKVVEGQTLRVIVGGGGQGATTGAAALGGYGGGGRGGAGDFGGGGGGGASRVELLTGDVVMVAAGGGGGGATQYCCAHGGFGGGIVGSAGESPLETPRDNDGLAPRTEHGYNDPRDRSGFPANHQHFDHGQQPDASLKVLASAGGGGSQALGGLAGKPGSWNASGGGVSATEPRANDTGSYKGNLNILKRNEGSEEARNGNDGYHARSIAAPGRFLIGGVGGWGREAGGGGGGGYYGGGGGGGGVDGAGGGGGSSFVSSLHLYIPTDTNLGVNAAAPSMSAYMVDHQSVLLRWTKPYHHPNSAPQAYIIEMSEALNGGGEEYYQVKEITAPNGNPYNRDGRGPGTIAGVSWDDRVEARQWLAEKLPSSTTFRFRVAATTLRGGVGDFSEPLIVTTDPVPVNKWRRIWPRGVSEGESGGGSSFVDPPYRNSPKWPSARSGHTSVMLGGYMYLFGGRSTGYVCDRSLGAPCHVPAPIFDQNGQILIHSDDHENHPNAELLSSGELTGEYHSSELWRYDPVVSEWRHLTPKTKDTPGMDPATGPPPGRDKHSAWNWRGDMYIFGGRANAEDHVGMRDLWKLDTGHVQEVSVQGGWNESIQDSRNLYSHIDTSSAQVPSHQSINDPGATLIPNSNLIAQGLCIVDIDVEIDAPHSCASDMRVWLYSRGPRVEGVNFTKDAGNFDNKVLLFHGGRQPLYRNEVDGCGDSNGGLRTTTFDDEATHDFAGSLSSSFPSDSNAEYGYSDRDGPRQACTACLGTDAPCQEKGTRVCANMVDGRCPIGYTNCIHSLRNTDVFRPEEPLSRFHGLEANGRWTLHIQDVSGPWENTEGSLNKWKLNFTLQPCTPTYEWQEVDPAYGGGAVGLATASWPSKRFSHATALVGDHVYVWGGISKYVKTDMWRLNMNADPSLMRWTELQPAGGRGIDNYYGYNPPERYGSTMLNTPWRFLSFGGLTEVKKTDGAPRYFDTLRQYDPISRAWSEISTTKQPVAPHRRHRVNRERESWQNRRELLRPTARLSHSAVLLGGRNTTSFDRGIGQGSNVPKLEETLRYPRLLLFGGYDGTRHLDDLWELQLGSLDYRLSSAVETKHREDMCKARLRGTSDKAWRDACQESNGLVDDPVCSVDEIMIRMWCQGPGTGYFQDPGLEGGLPTQPAHSHSISNV